MAIPRHTQEIDRSVEDVFGTVIDGGKFATWNPTISASRQLTPDPIGEGTRFEWKLRGFGNVDQELQEFEPNRRVRIVPHHRSLSGGHRVTFTDLGGRTCVDHDLEMAPKGTSKVFLAVDGEGGQEEPRPTASALGEFLT